MAATIRIASETPLTEVAIYFCPLTSTIRVMSVDHVYLSLQVPADFFNEDREQREVAVALQEDHNYAPNSRVSTVSINRVAADRLQRDLLKVASNMGMERYLQFLNQAAKLHGEISKTKERLREEQNQKSGIRKIRS